MALPIEWTRLAPTLQPLRDGEKFHVFLSYRSVNRIWVLNLYDILHELGLQVFIDQVVLAGGDELIRVLEEGLGKSQAGVLVWSAAAADSDWVRREYQAMLGMVTEKEGFRFVPLRLDDTKLPLFAAGLTFLDFRSYPDGPNGGELLRLLYGITGLPLSLDAAHFAAAQDA